MRHITAIGALVLAAGSAYADVAGVPGSASQEAGLTSTIRPDGPRQFDGALSQLFFNVQGSSGGNFASFGALRYDGAAIVSDLDAQLGTGNWVIESISLSLTQSNAGFTTNGLVDVLWAADDSVDITSPAGVTFPSFTGQFGTESALASYNFIEVADGFVDVIDLSGAGLADLAGDILSGDLVTLLLTPGDASVAATWAGNDGNFDGPGPILTVNAVKIPAPGPAALFGLAGLAAARRRR